jgi:hypothetical protein
LAPWEGSVTWRGGVVTLARGEVTPRREREETTLVWADTNLIGPKNEENSHCCFNYYKWTVKI